MLLEELKGTQRQPVHRPEREVEIEASYFLRIKRYLSVQPEPECMLDAGRHVSHCPLVPTYGNRWITNGAKFKIKICIIFL